jgi:glycosyltransferase involved in cell wall biosynthesis
VKVRGERTGDATPAPRVLIIVQNLPVPFDRRVWLECRALIEAGYDVSVICPKGPGDPDEEVLEGVSLDKYEPFRTNGRMLDFVAEYAYSLAMTFRLSRRVWRRGPFEIIQACNPPDIFWMLALVYRARGTRFIFDHHDLCPELYESRFPGRARSVYWGLRFLEWCTFRTADHVIATNQSYRAVALGRGRKSRAEVTVVRTGPDPDVLRPHLRLAGLRRGRRYLAAYLGVMGPQDGVDIVLRAAHRIVHELGRDDISFTLIGSGDCYDELRALCEELDLDDYVEFTGRAPDDVVSAVLSTADIALSPDPKNPLNDVSTMNKTMEYMAFELPVVAFDLVETRASAESAAVYVEPNDVDRYADAIVELLEDPVRREQMGTFGRARILNELAWNHQRDAYVGVYDELVAQPPARTVVDTPEPLAVSAATR